MTVPQQLISNVYNFNPSTNMTHWRKAAANVLNNTANGRIAWIGNSVSLGVGGGGTNVGLSSGEIHAPSPPTRVAGFLTAGGITAHWNSWVGTGTGANANNWPCIGKSNADARVTAGSSWSATGNGSLGGVFLTATTTTNAISFTPSVAVDNFTVFYNNQSSPFTLDINGGSPVTITPNGTNTFASANIVGTLGTNTLNMKYLSGAGVFLVGMTANNSAVKSIDVMNCGWSGGSWTGAVAGNMDNAGAEQALVGLAPDLSFICGSINDWATGASISVMASGMQNMITKAKLSGDAVIITDNPSRTSGGGFPVSQAAQQAYINAMYQLANTNNIPIIDIFQRWNTYTISDTLGLIFEDSTGNNFHPNNLGYWDIARTVANLLLSA